MSLIDTMKETCQMMDKVSVPDGIGGFINSWRPGAEFQAAIVKDTSPEARIAEHDGVTELYTVTFSKDLPMEYHDVFVRKRDGATFRVTSNVNDSRTPKVATFQFGQVSAERWNLA